MQSEDGWAGGPPSDDDDEVPLAVRMDALRRMQGYKARVTGQLELTSGNYRLSDTPIELEVYDAKAALDRGEEVCLLDVREQSEYDFCRVDGSLLIPMSQMRERAEEVPKDKQVLVMCHHGVRSMQVVRYLRTKGWSRITNISGGIDAWSQQVDPKVPRY